MQTFGVTSAIKVIAKHQTIQLKPQYLFQTSDNLCEQRKPRENELTIFFYYRSRFIRIEEVCKHPFYIYW